MDLPFPGSWLPLSLLVIAVFAVSNGTGTPTVPARDNIYRQGTDTPSITEEDTMMNAVEEMAMNEDAKLNSLSTKDAANHHKPHESNKTIVESKLFISLLNGIDLPGKDILSSPDAYVRFWAHEYSGEVVSKDSVIDWDTRDPYWNEVLYFGPGKWFSLWAQIFDQDVFVDDELSSKQRFYFKGNCEKKIVAFNNGTATFLYYLQPLPPQ